jgi:hypothetical protein
MQDIAVFIFVFFLPLRPNPSSSASSPGSWFAAAPLFTAVFALNSLTPQEIVVFLFGPRHHREKPSGSPQSLTLIHPR